MSAASTKAKRVKITKSADPDARTIDQASPGQRSIAAEKDSDIGAGGNPRAEHHEVDGVRGNVPRLEEAGKLEGAAAGEDEDHDDGREMVELGQEDYYGEDHGDAEKEEQEALKDVAHRAPPYRRSRALYASTAIARSSGPKSGQYFSLKNSSE